jgi:hypothetical protein
MKPEWTSMKFAIVNLLSGCPRQFGSGHWVPSVDLRGL